MLLASYEDSVVTTQYKYEMRSIATGQLQKHINKNLEIMGKREDVPPAYEPRSSQVPSETSFQYT